MPKRTAEHVVGDLASQRVSYLFTEYGCACEVVEKDYGEDLMIQPIWQSQVEPYRLWLQVKGTRNLEGYRTSDGDFVLRVSKPTLQRWIESADLSVVILWDVSNDRGYWCIPEEVVDPLSLAFSETSTSSLKIESLNCLDGNGIDTIIWKTRFRHYLHRMDVCAKNDTRFFDSSTSVLFPEKTFEDWAAPGLGTEITFGMTLKG
jgi:hypothetical protein